jgi:hypothetical protein
MRHHGIRTLLRTRRFAVVVESSVLLVGVLSGLLGVGALPATAATGPTVTAISPATGPLAGGAAVTITGTGFSTMASDDTVEFGTVARR